MPFIWSTSPQLPQPTPPERIPSTATSAKVDVVANNVEIGCELSYNTVSGAYDIICELPSLNVRNIIARSANSSTSNITSVNLISGTVQTNANSGLDIVNFYSRGGGGGTALIDNVFPILYQTSNGLLSLATSGISARYLISNSPNGSTLISNTVSKSFDERQINSHPSIHVNNDKGYVSLVSAGDPILSGHRYGNSWVPSNFMLPFSTQVNWFETAYNGNVFVMIGNISDSGATMISSDGVNWRNLVFHSPSFFLRSPAVTSVSFRRILWAPQHGKFYVFTYDQSFTAKLLATSSDGVNWAYNTNIQPPYPTILDQADTVVYGGGRFVSTQPFAFSVKMTISDDAITWSNATTFTANSPIAADCIGYSDSLNRFVVIGRNDPTPSLSTQKFFHFSNDGGYTWESGPTNSLSSICTTTYKRVVYGEGTYVSSGHPSILFSTTNQVLVSSDGANWSGRSLANVDSFFGSGLTALSFGNGLFVTGPINANTVDGRPAQVYVSDDTNVWTTVNIPTNILVPAHITYGADKFASLGAGTFGSNVYSYGNQSATIWTNSTKRMGGRISLTAGGSGNSIFVAVTGQTAFVSIDGKEWDTNTNSIHGDWSSVAWNGNVFAAVGIGSNVQTSPTGYNWTIRSSITGSYNDIAWNGNLFVAVGESGAVMTSPTGVTWTSRTAPSNNWNGVISNDILTVAVGSSNAIMTSPDGINWTYRIGVVGHWSSVAWNGNVFAAVGNSSNIIMTSPDGITWTPRETPITGVWTNIAWNGSVFAAVGTNSVITSPDGIHWTIRKDIPQNKWLDIAWNGSVFAAVANSNTPLTMSTEPMSVTSVAGKIGRVLLNTNDVLENSVAGLYQTQQRIRDSFSATYPIEYSADSGVFSHANVAGVPGTYGNSSHSLGVSVDNKGHVTSTINTQIIITTSNIVDGILSTAKGGTGKNDIGLVNGSVLIGNTVNTGFDVNIIAQTHPIIVTNGRGSITLSHATSGAVPGTYGNTTIVPSITVDSNGHITNITNVAIPTIPTPSGNGVTFIGNAVSGLFQQSTITPGTGITITNGPGSITITSPNFIPTGNGTDKVFYENSLVMTGNYTLTTGKSAFSTGPITFNPGISLTIPPGSRWIQL